MARPVDGTQGMTLEFSDLQTNMHEPAWSHTQRKPLPLGSHISCFLPIKKKTTKSWVLERRLSG